MLAIDEMDIKGCLNYDSGLDVIQSFNDGVIKSNELANHALAFMIKGIVEKWKQPIGYFLFSTPMTGSDMKVLLLQCIWQLRTISL